jgi:hypothetical protein
MIHAWILNTPTFPTHQNTKFIIISYNWNLYIIIQCKKLLKQNYNSFQYISDTTKNSHNNMNLKIIAKVCTSLIY